MCKPKRMLRMSVQPWSDSTKFQLKMMKHRWSCSEPRTSKRIGYWMFWTSNWRGATNHVRRLMGPVKATAKLELEQQRLQQVRKWTKAVSNRSVGEQIVTVVEQTKPRLQLRLLPNTVNRLNTAQELERQVLNRELESLRPALVKARFTNQKKGPVSHHRLFQVKPPSKAD